MPKILLIPLITAACCQGLKLLLVAFRLKRFPWNRIDAYGGMPSTHTAMVVSLVTVIIMSEGMRSPLVAIAVVFSLIVVRDAIGFRRYLGWHSEALNHIMKHDLPNHQKTFRQFTEQVGHTPLQAFVGGLLGLAISWLLFGLIP